MKKLLMLLSVLFVCTVAFAHTINWHVEDQIISTTTCNSGDAITPPTVPTKYGYHPKVWGPSQYIKLEYIESTGTQYIDTGYVPTNATRLDIKYKVTQLPSDLRSGAVPIGARVAWQDRMFGIFSPVNQQNTNMLMEANVALTFSFNPLNKEIIATIDIPNNYRAFDVEGTVYSSNASYAKVTYVYPLYMFQQNLAGIVSTSDAHIRIYYVQIKENNVLVRNFIPARRITDKAIGMYDTVTQTFFENQGAGTFIAGPAVGYIQ